MDMFEEEKKYLDYTLKSIDDEIEKLEEDLRKSEKDSRKLSFEDRKRGAHFQLNSNMEMTGKIIHKLRQSKDVPFFGQIDFSLRKDSPNQILHIGKCGVSHNNERIVTDWRAPICSVYYDSELGETEYEANGKIFDIYLNSKRQINIKNGRLIDVQDASLVVNDDLLKPYLSLKADNKMKIIVASIQKEQNSIIRRPGNSNLIIQGVAGSGKTSVALHRIAYLIYNMSSNISSDSFLLLGPNDYFLNYISSILPELETSPINQETLVSFVNEYTGEKFKLKEKNLEDYKKEEQEIYKKIENFKSSLEYQKYLDLFINDYLKEEIVSEDFSIEDNVIFTKEKIKEILFSIDKDYPNFEMINNYFKSKLKDNMNQIIDEIKEKYKEKYRLLSFEDPERRMLIDESHALSNKIKKDGMKLLNNYLKKLKRSTLSIYLSFISNIDKYNCPLSEKEKLYFQKISLLSLNNKNVCFEDIPSLIHIKYRLTGEKVNYKYIVIDEAQDFGLFHFQALKEITNNCNFSIYGDLAQSICSYRSIKNWEDVNENIFNNSCEILNLNKSYRTTIEITENANNVLKQLNLKTAEPVIRNGKSVLFSDNSFNTSFKANIIKEWVDSGYKTIAVICKTDSEVKKVCKELSMYGVNSISLTNNKKEFDGNIFVLTSSASKGLEFDTVIINNASSNVYSVDSDVDMHLLYVASTRALHEQVILYDKDITPVYDVEMKKIKVKK